MLGYRSWVLNQMAPQTAKLLKYFLNPSSQQPSTHLDYGLDGPHWMVGGVRQQGFEVHFK